MDLNITRFFHEAPHRDYAASAMELGQNAGQITWQNAMGDAYEWALLPDAELETFADWVRGTGGWSDEEVDAMSNQELQALCVQFVAGWIRDAFGDDTTELTEEDWSDYYARAQAGEVAGAFSRDSKGQVFCYFGD